MTILVDWEIKQLIRERTIKVDPYDESLINPASLDYRLGTTFGRVVAKSDYIDPTDKESFTTLFEESESYGLEPGGFVIAASLETISIPPYISAYALGKSSLGRLGIQSSTPFAGWIDPGFTAPSLTLEIFNASQSMILLKSGMKIGQYIFYRHRWSDRPYGSEGVGRYQGQGPGTGSKGID